MIVRWLRSLDYVEAGAETWEPDVLARVLIAAGYAVEAPKRTRTSAKRATSRDEKGSGTNPPRCADVR